MNKIQLYGKIQDLLSSLDNQSILFIEVMHLFSGSVLDMKEYDSLIQEQVIDQQNRRELSNKVASAITTERNEYRTSEILRSVIKFEESLSEIKGLLPKNSAQSTGLVISSFHEKLDVFLDEFDLYKANETVGTGFNFAIASRDLCLSLNYLKPHLISLLPECWGEDSGGRDEISLYLSNVETLNDFGKKLIAIEELYAVFIELNGENINDSPIVVRSIESGSLVLSILSLPVVGEMIKMTLGRAASYIQGEYTRKGQIEGLPTAISSIEGVLRISEQLEKNGVDITEINEQLQSATTKIARNLNTLIRDQPCVQINDVLHDVGEDRAKLMIEQSKTMKLEDHRTTGEA